jgi:hypothetical protein
MINFIKKMSMLLRILDVLQSQVLDIILRVENLETLSNEKINKIYTGTLYE